jgi:hypothetical protein
VGEVTTGSACSNAKVCQSSYGWSFESITILAGTKYIMWDAGVRQFNYSVYSAVSSLQASTLID